MEYNLKRYYLFNGGIINEEWDITKQSRVVCWRAECCRFEPQQWQEVNFSFWHPVVRVFYCER
jgi:hypothetical protein